MSDRITISADDGILAMVELRAGIEKLDKMIAGDKSEWAQEHLPLIRAEKFAGYQRICKALGMKPMLADVPAAQEAT